MLFRGQNAYQVEEMQCDAIARALLLFTYSPVDAAERGYIYWTEVERNHSSCRWNICILADRARIEISSRNRFIGNCRCVSLVAENSFIAQQFEFYMNSMQMPKYIVDKVKCTRMQPDCIDCIGITDCVYDKKHENSVEKRQIFSLNMQIFLNVDV